MNSIVKSRTAGATILLAVLLGSAACGSETVTENGPGTQPGIEARIYPPVSVPTAPLGEKKVRHVGRDGRAPGGRGEGSSGPRIHRAVGTRHPGREQAPGRLARSPLKKDGTDPLGQRSVPSFLVVSGRPRG